VTFRHAQRQWYTIISLLLPILYVAKYFILKHNQYLTIEKDIIKINNAFGKQIVITEINQIEKYAGKYIIKTDKKKLTIDTHIIEKKTRIALDTILEKLNVKWI
jgi:hypothetical protein